MIIIIFIIIIIRRRKKKKQISGSCLLAEKCVEHESVGDTNCSLSFWNGSQRPLKETGGIGDQRKKRDHCLI